MEITEDLAAWVSLSRAAGFGGALLQRMLEASGSAAALLGLAPRELLALGASDSAARSLARAARLSRNEQRWLEAPGHLLLPFTDPGFPPLLRAVPGCPIVLYVSGDASRLLDPQLAIVGSRNPTAAGSENAHDFAAHLALQGLTITSGLAEGIDSAAHRGALDAGGGTIAVLGTGIDLVYPRWHAELAARISAQGALVSEFALGTPGRAANFPQRNRIIAGLSLGTLVVEAARRSGSLITARLAGEAGREVFALPGSIHNPLARGCHQLIRDGAKLTQDAADILSELNFSHLPEGPARAPPDADTAAPAKPAMDKAHEILLDALGFEPSDLDVLVLRTGFRPEEVSSMMLNLELEGLVRSVHGGRYTRISRSR
ncbi:MAG: DNA-processing protein DprA [Steroidobacteraceae bacterium]